MTISSSSEWKWKKNQPWGFFLGVGSAQLSSSGVAAGLEGGVSIFSVGSGTGVCNGVGAGVAAGRSLVAERSLESRDSSSDRLAGVSLSLLRLWNDLRTGVAGTGVGLGVGVGLGTICISCRLFKNSCRKRCSSSEDCPGENDVAKKQASARMK